MGNGGSVLFGRARLILISRAISNLGSKPQTKEVEMETVVKNIKELVGTDLKGFSIVEMTEVYRVNDDGRKSVSLGFFQNSDIAAAFAGVQSDANWHKTWTAMVLTDGTVGYVISDGVSVKLFDDKTEAVEIKKKALAKLSPAERALFGFK